MDAKEEGEVAECDFATGELCVLCIVELEVLGTAFRHGFMRMDMWRANRQFTRMFRGGG